MKINDRVAYAEDPEALGLATELHGTVVEPTRGDLDNQGVSAGDVFVEWDDGMRFWEDPASLVIVQIAEERA